MKRFSPAMFATVCCAVTLSLSVWSAPSAWGQAVELGPWSGAVTDESAVVKVKMDQWNTPAQLVVSTFSDLSNPVQTLSPLVSHATSNIAAFDVTGLNANTTYYYGVDVNGTIAPLSMGRFQTFATGPASFTFAFGSCADTGTTHPVFDHILNQNPLFFMNVGDFHYSNIAVNDPDLFRDAYDTVLSSPPQAQLYRNVPFVYIWDDHDFGPNDADGTSPSRLASRLTYQEYVPHYDLAHGSGDVPIDQSFTVGRVRFVMTDTRSERDPKTDLDGPDKKMFTEQQVNWFKQQVLEAKAAGEVVFWVNSVPWISDPLVDGDHWGGYTHQRAEIANWLADNEIDNLVILGGDSHSTGADDGTNANYSDDPLAPIIRVLHAAALNRGGSVKGGPYSEGMFPNPSMDYGQYGTVTVTDLGHDGIHVLFTGWRVDLNGDGTELLDFDFMLYPIPEPASLALIGLGGAMLLRRRRTVAC